jgi:hypothetical protein
MDLSGYIARCFLPPLLAYLTQAMTTSQLVAVRLKYSVLRYRHASDDWLDSASFLKSPQYVRYSFYDSLGYTKEVTNIEYSLESRPRYAEAGEYVYYGDERETNTLTLNPSPRPNMA